ncbi:hypothetical protein TNIN_2881 [Trichonephila inaurata madagascariensis]|uniref:Uncharacterized protein n=1 Tax=Trichonephila inaurata madagascariensis TaxID=2747483 RepID=A0A8X6X4Q0_9ARAC|nr:hypothetical protein TNIN_2881 [Trichonephila inaurata madagascariensis]
MVADRTDKGCGLYLSPLRVERRSEKVRSPVLPPLLTLPRRRLIAQLRRRGNGNRGKLSQSIPATQKFLPAANEVPEAIKKTLAFPILHFSKGRLETACGPGQTYRPILPVPNVWKNLKGHCRRRSRAQGP